MSHSFNIRRTPPIYIEVNHRTLKAAFPDLDLSASYLSSQTSENGENWDHQSAQVEIRRLEGELTVAQANATSLRKEVLQAIVSCQGS